MIKRITRFSLLICLLFTYSVYSQNIFGVVVSDSTKISRAQIVVKKGHRIISYTITDNDGKFVFHNILEDSLEVQAAHLNYKTQSIFLPRPTSEIVKIELVEKINTLQEVIIKKDLPIRQKKDTIVYNPEHFKDGSERVIEDLLKKLPGITVNDAGKISFKGKEIQALMLDGDDLFNSKYTIGSKNLDVNDVESIEAIENFNQNKVLHKITDSDKVAINLKLKKGKPVLTSRAELENDFYSKYDNSVTTLLLHSLYKGFSDNGINNIGNVNELDFSFDDADITNKIKTKELISEGSFPQYFGGSNSLLNNTFNTNNALKFKASKHTSSTFGVNYYKDRLWQDIENVTKYQYNTQNFDYVNSDHQVKKPEVFSVSNQIEYYNDKDLQVNTKIVFEKHQSNFENDAVNNGVLRESNVNTDVLFFGGKTEVTKMLGQNSAMNFYAILSQNKSEQFFLLAPAIDIDDSVSADRQLNDITTSFFAGQAQYYQNWEKVKLKITNTSERKTDRMMSWLAEGNVAAEGFQNNIDFQSFVNKLATQISFGVKKFKFALEETLWYNQAEKADQKFSDFQNLFRADAKYSISKKHSVQFVFFQSLETPLLENVFEAPILNSYRNVSFNEGKMDNIKRTEASLSYTISDFYNTFFFRASVNRTLRDKDYYSTILITPELIYNKTVLLNQGNNMTSFNLSVHKLIPFIKVNVKYNASYIFSSMFNFIDDSTLRSVRSKSFNNELILYTKINSKLNLDNKVNIDSNFFEANNEQQNALTQVKNEFKVNYKMSKLFSLQSILQTFIPDSQNKQTYNFLGFEALYNLEKLNCEIYLRGQNLLNYKTFSSVLVSDFAVSSFSYKLQERNILLGLRLKIF